MEENNENKKVIDFEFDWIGKDYDKIIPNVMAMARKLVELDQIRVEKELDENGNIKILHTGVCRKNGLVESLSKGIVNEDIYSCVFRTSPKSSLNCLCKGRDESKANYCQMPSCPILVAGYLYYLQHINNSEKQEIAEFTEDATENDIYSRNYNELKKMEFDKDIEELLNPLAIPSIKGLRCAFIGEEGTDKEKITNDVAEYLYKIGKISTSKVKYINLNTNIVFEDDVLYSILGLQDYLDNLSNNDDFSGAASSERRNNKFRIQTLINNSKGKYIIINGTPLELKKFLASNPKLPYIFDTAVYFKDFEDEKILNIFEKNLPEYHKKFIDDDKRKTFLDYLDRNRKYFPFKNRDLSMFLAGYVSRKSELILPKERYEESTLDDMFKDLIGMNNVKQQLIELNNFLKFQKKLEEQGKTIPNFNLHMMFLGNPGTGKTTVARMVAKTLFDLGYIQENKCVEVESKDLIAPFSRTNTFKNR